MKKYKFPERYVQRPPIVEAQQFWPRKRPWPGGVKKHHSMKNHYIFGSGFGPPQDVHPGDWIIRPVSPDGIAYVCRAGDFSFQFEPEKDVIERRRQNLLREVFG